MIPIVRIPRFRCDWKSTGATRARLGGQDSPDAGQEAWLHPSRFGCAGGLTSIFRDLDMPGGGFPEVIAALACIGTAVTLYLARWVTDATVMAPMIASGPAGSAAPAAVSRPPPSSVAPARAAIGLPGVSPIRSKPLRPGPALGRRKPRIASARRARPGRSRAQASCRAALHHACRFPFVSLSCSLSARYVRQRAERARFRWRSERWIPRPGPMAGRPSRPGQRCGPG
jgi:hypothetical protein